MTAAAKLVRSPAKARWPQMGIVKSMLIASVGPARGLLRGLSRMWGNSQVRFLGAGRQQCRLATRPAWSSCSLNGVCSKLKCPPVP